MTKTTDNKVIHIEGARHHNLKNLTLDIPRDQLVVVCGPSGSGKSTLAFDIVYAEGQRRYVESLSAYARQFLPQMDKPDVDKVEGLSPAISLEQQTATRNPRSTVGTVTEVYDFLRVFYARLGKYYCPSCGKPIEAQTTDEIVKAILAMAEGTKFMLLAPLVDHQKGTHKDLFAKLKKEGFVRVRIGGELFSLDEVPELEKHKKHTIELVVDRLVIKDNIKKRLADSVELALERGDERMIVSVVGGDTPGDTFMSTLSTCPACKISMPRLTPQLFSFNSPQGACPNCNGLGFVEYFEPDLIAPNKGLSLNQGGVIPWKSAYRQEQYGPQLKKLGKQHGFTLDTPLEDYSEEAWSALFHGSPETGWPGIVPILEYGQQQSGVWDHWTAQFQQSRPCPTCEGARLKPEALAVRVADKNMFEFTDMSIQRALDWLNDLTFSGHDTLISEPLLKELTHRLGFMVNVGLEYLSLGRNMATLSGGEAQRIRLASQLGSGLVGVTYVLDEPSIGLHPRDNKRLLDTLRSLQARGNTVLVVEHDEPTILHADHVIEIGPSSGWLGGEVVFQGPVDKLLKADTLTGKYLRGDMFIEPPETRRKAKGFITLKNVQTNNLKNLDVDIPLGVMTCVTGVSGSGKSSLVMDSMYKHLLLHRGQKANNPGKIGGINGLDKIEKVISIDQSPIGRTPRSNPATYTKIFDEIRKIFTGSKEARKRGYQPGRFSFNVKGGRCEACKGDGQIRVEMHFLPDVYVTCETCKGKRYNAQTLEVEYRGKNIADVLDMTVRQARDFFANHPALMRKLDVLAQVGLEYVKLGQPATTLSGGEAQRIKISRELGKRSLPGALYILDEPTTGLHMHEVGKLIRVLHALVDKNATVIVIEHNTDVIMASDHVIDLGPGGGEHGGRIVASGTPEEIIENPESVTGQFLVR
ncbi:MULTISPECIES: excinuclease ABC subunit UvrA [unclassified Pseudodesulfovibrio]|uniref:excinuclease ABC subunit UvrA n=1 Tax=unclassified Pseudodesulfovibrio TaxID=2661612 RepID=UPI000FEBB7FE|nr:MULTISPECIES: excinuclease ABC subunit UvrA [unclassified Pseudodesulfovibrio]MCJ2165677.1 excinuclease ABC subunit UvrA [Pseudodesulfovibrio sp. S3-i]RWU02942.1 excinuclease ABC subunit UvrA [Pseudodesulfovibrio sp. S3]